MTWLTWRQFRIPVLSVFAALAVIGVILAVSGVRMADQTNFAGEDFMLGATTLVMYALPAVIGVFWGVPLITREVEAGTHSLVWNQTVTRKRWLTTKMGVGVLAAMVAAGLLSLGVSWWASPIDTLASQQTDPGMLGRMSPVMFAARGIAPIGYAAFAFVVGVTAGIVLRRTVAAMAVTLVVLTAVLLAVPFFVRPYVLPPLEETVTIGDNITQINGNGDGIKSIGVENPPGVWVLTNETVDPSGAVVSPLPDFVRNCIPGPDAHKDAVPPDIRNVRECLAQLNEHGYKQRLTFQPGYRFWPLQWIELALFLALSALLTWFCFRRLRHLS